MTCLDARGRSVELPARLGYDPVDPYAVQLVFGQTGEDVCWLVSRDLLLDGLTQPSGEGDILLWPSIDDCGCAAVVLELCSPDGRLVMQLSSRDLGAFLARTLLLVPQGTERLDLDGLVEALISQAP